MNFTTLLSLFPLLLLLLLEIVSKVKSGKNKIKSFLKVFTNIIEKELSLISLFMKTLSQVQYRK